MPAGFTDLAALIPELLPMLCADVGERIELRTVGCDGLWPIRAHPSKLPSAILNLTLHARDAMPKGGLLQIMAENRTIDTAAAVSNLQPGQDVALIVSDNGEGMSQAVKAWVFELFFTTKAAGRGTGLGLAMVRDLVRQVHGHITIESDQGHGTAVCLYLQRVSPLTPELGLSTL